MAAGALPLLVARGGAAPISFLGGPVADLRRRELLLGSAGVFVLAACGTDVERAATPSLTISAIPDQDPEKLNRLYPVLAERFAGATKLTVAYRPVTDYTAVVRAFEVGDIHLAWMGGLTGVQARNRVRGARALAQRDIDRDFHSLFIANKAADLTPFDKVDGVRTLAGHTFTFGSQTSTSGRLMPQYFMRQGGLDPAAFKGRPGFSGSHDATIEAVASGSFEAGVVNEQVWKATQAAGKVDLSGVVVLWRTPGYADYHWLARPDLDDRFGRSTTQSVTDTLLGLNVARPADKTILDLFGATSFVTTDNANYDQIEAVAREQGLLA
jgi:phosphonate transport system substrate-binding protein